MKKTEAKCSFTAVARLFVLIAFKNILSPVFKPEELRRALMPTLQALLKHDPELSKNPVSVLNYSCSHHSNMTQTNTG